MDNNSDKPSPSHETLQSSFKNIEALFSEADIKAAKLVTENVCDCCGMTVDFCESFRIKEEIFEIERKIHKLHFGINADSPKKTEAEIVSDASAELFDIVEKKKIKTVSAEAAMEIDALSITRSEMYSLLEKSWRSCEPARVNWKLSAITMQLKLIQLFGKKPG